MLIKIHVSAPQQHKKLTKLQETNIDSTRGMATRITDSTLVSKFAPVPRSVSGGEPGFISIRYRIFRLSKNIGGGEGWVVPTPLIKLSTFAEYETNLKM